MTIVPNHTVADQDFRLGVYYCIAGIFLFQVLNLLGKHLAESYPIPLLVFFRSVFALMASTVLVAKLGGQSALKTKRPVGVLIRALIWAAMMVCSFFSYHLLPVADAATIGFSAPIFVTVLAAVFLREKVGYLGWLAVLIGFAGVVIVVRPSADLLRFGTLFAVGNALFYALGALMVRWLSRTEESAIVVFYCCLVSSLLSGVLLPFFWITPSFGDLLQLLVLGIIGAAAQYLATQGLRYAPASVISPITYSGLLWAIFFGYLFWGEFPDALGLLGAALIVGAGLLILKNTQPNSSAT